VAAAGNYDGTWIQGVFDSIPAIPAQTEVHCRIDSGVFGDHAEAPYQERRTGRRLLQRQWIRDNLRRQKSNASVQSSGEFGRVSQRLQRAMDIREQNHDVDASLLLVSGQRIGLPTVYAEYRAHISLPPTSLRPNP
jgi:hypothetical protein